MLGTLVLLCCLYHVYCGHGGGATKRAYQPLDESDALPTYNEARILRRSTPAPGPWTWDPTLSKFVKLGASGEAHWSLANQRSISGISMD